MGKLTGSGIPFTRTKDDIAPPPEFDDAFSNLVERTGVARTVPEGMSLRQDLLNAAYPRIAGFEESETGIFEPSLLSPTAGLVRHMPDEGVISEELMPAARLGKLSAAKINKLRTLKDKKAAQNLVNAVISEQNPVQDIPPQDRVDVERSYQAAIAEEAGLNKTQNVMGETIVDRWGTNLPEQEFFGTAATAQFNEVEDPTQYVSEFVAAGKQGIDSLNIFMKNKVPQLTGRYQAMGQGFQYQTNFADDFLDYTEKFSQDYNEDMQPQMRLSDPANRSRMQLIMSKAGHKNWNSLTHLNFTVLQGAKQNMESNIPGGLAAAMLLGTLFNLHEGELARSRPMQTLIEEGIVPSNTSEYEALTEEQKEGFKALEAAAFFEETGSEKGIGYLIAQAGGLRMTGGQINLLGTVAKNQVMKTFPDWFIDNEAITQGAINNLDIDNLRLSRGMMRFVGDNLQMIKFLMKIPLKPVRTERRAWSETQLNLSKPKQDILHNLYSGKNFTSPEKEDYAKLAQWALENNARTIYTPGLMLENLFHGMDPDSAIETPNLITPLLEGKGKGFKNIKNKTHENGEATTPHNRVKFMMKFTEEGGVKVADFGDINMDTKRQHDLFLANKFSRGATYFVDYNRAEHRFYERTDGLNTDDHWARAMTGSGVFIDFKIDGKSREARVHLELIKAGLMRNIGMKVPGKGLKYDMYNLAENAKGYDENIIDWQRKYSRLVDLAEGFQNKTFSWEQEQFFREKFFDPDNELTLAATDFIEMSRDLNGIYTRNAIIEAIRLKKALDKGAPVFRSNIMTSADGTNHGLAMQAMIIAFSRILEGTGLSVHLIGDSAAIARGEKKVEPYGGEGGLLAGAGPAYDQAAISAADYFETSSIPALKQLGKILYDNGLLGREGSKDPVMVSAYGAGEGKIMRLGTKAIADVIKENPEVLDKLNDIRLNQSDVGQHIGKSSWNSITETIGPIQAYTRDKQEFMNNLIAQKILNPNLPNPKWISPSGEIITFGAAVATAHGPTYESEYGNIPATREVNLTLEATGRKYDPETAKLRGQFSASTQFAPKSIHPYDGNQVENMVYRQLVSNPGEAYGHMGPVFIPKHDGYYFSPMFLPIMDLDLNETFLNIGFKFDVTDNMVHINRKLGYDMEFAGTADVESMTTIISRLKTEEARGKEAIKQLRYVSQFPINGMSRTAVTSKGEVMVKRESPHASAHKAMLAMGYKKHKDPVSAFASALGVKKVDVPVFNYHNHRWYDPGPAKKLPKLSYKADYIFKDHQLDVPSTTDKLLAATNVEKFRNNKRLEPKSFLSSLSNKDKTLYKTEDFMKGGRFHKDQEAMQEEIKILSNISRFKPGDTVYHATRGEGKVGGGYKTDKALVNKGASPITYTIDFFDQKGLVPIEERNLSDSPIISGQQQDLY